MGPGAQGVNLGDLGRGKPGGPQNHGLAGIGHFVEMAERRLGMGEFDDHLRLGQNLTQGIHHRDPLAGQPHYLTHIFTYGGMSRRLHRPRQAKAFHPLHQVHDAAAHAACHPADNGFNHNGLRI